MNDQRNRRFIVLCARPRPAPGAASEAGRLAAAGLDWDALLESADLEGVLPLLYWNVQGLVPAVPAAVLDRLRLGFMRNAARNTRALRDLAPVVSAIRDAGVRAALTKGARLAPSAYPDIALRPFWDVDLLVKPSDWPVLEAVLRERGFVEAEGSAPGLPKAGREPGWTYSPYFRRGELVLEVHFTYLGLHLPFRSEGEFWASLRRIPIQGAEAEILSPEFELALLCIHAQQHSYQRLIWLVDIAEMASTGAVDWDVMTRLCKTESIFAPVYSGLHLAESLWPGTLPPGVLAGFRPGAAVRAALGMFWPEGSLRSGRALAAWPYYMPSLFALGERRSPALAVRTVAAIFFPPKAWLAAASGVAETSPRIYLQYAKRIFRPLRLAAGRIVSSR
jgi:hypothetical protein